MDRKGCALVCVVSGGILWDKDHRRRGCSEGRRGGRGAAEVATVGGKGQGGEGKKMTNSVWDITKFKKPKRHLSARILADGPAQLTS